MMNAITASRSLSLIIFWPHWLFIYLSPFWLRSRCLLSVVVLPLLNFTDFIHVGCCLSVCRDLHENRVFVYHIFLFLAFIWISGKQSKYGRRNIFTVKRYLWICGGSSQTALPIVSHPNLTWYRKAIIGTACHHQDCFLIAAFLCRYLQLPGLRSLLLSI